MNQNQSSIIPSNELLILVNRPNEQAQNGYPSEMQNEDREIP